MNSQRLLAIIEKIPVVFLLVAFLGWLGYDYYYNFQTDPASPLVMHKAQLEQTNAEVVSLTEKIRRAKEFYKTLDEKRSEIRGLSLQLDQLKASLSEELDLPSFMRLVTTEAEKVGVEVMSIKPGETGKGEYTVDQVYELQFHSVYIQLLVFLQRLSNLERIIRVESLTFKPAQNASGGNYVALEGTLKLKTYRYIGTKADDVGASSPPIASAPGAPAKKVGTP